GSRSRAADCSERNSIDKSGIGRYIVDFYCPEARLVIELDGESHFSITVDEYEADRTKYLQQEGLRVIRFENKELYDNLEGVLETIKQACRSETSSVSDHPGRSS